MYFSPLPPLPWVLPRYLTLRECRELLLRLWRRREEQKEQKRTRKQQRGEERIFKYEKIHKFVSYAALWEAFGSMVWMYVRSAALARPAAPEHVASAKAAAAQNHPSLLPQQQPPATDGKSHPVRARVGIFLLFLSFCRYLPLAEHNGKVVVKGTWEMWFADYQLSRIVQSI